MRLPVDLQGNIDVDLVTNMVDIFIENGFSYFDTAYGYMGKQAEKVLKTCLVDRYPREQFVIGDKLTLSKIPQFSSMHDYFFEQLNNLGLDYIDVYLLHGLDSKKYELAKELNCFQFISSLKENKKIKYGGVSFHDKSEMLEKILYEQKDIDYVQLQINYLDWKDDLVQAEKCLNVAKKFNKRVIVMEPLKGGLLASVREMNKDLVTELDMNMSFASWGIRFAASQDNVEIVLSGMNSIEQMCDNLNFMKDFTPISNHETNILFEIVREYKNKSYIPCTKCKYCLDVCPQKLNIPMLLQILNEIKRTNNKSLFFNMKTYYESYSYSYKNATYCVGCGNCESECPQKIAIKEHMNELKIVFG